MGNVEGRRILVTGSSPGLGRAFVVALAAQCAHVVVNGTNAEFVDHVVDEMVSTDATAVAAVGSVAHPVHVPKM